MLTHVSCLLALPRPHPPPTHTQGVSTSQAQVKYMELLQDCPAFASTFFEADYVNKDQRFPKDLWLAINRVGIQIYKRGAVAPVQRYAYETYADELMCSHCMPDHRKWTNFPTSLRRSSAHTSSSELVLKVITIVFLFISVTYTTR